MTQAIQTKNPLSVVKKGIVALFTVTTDWIYVLCGLLFVDCLGC